MIDSTTISVEAFHLNEHQNWELKEYNNMDDRLNFYNLGFDIQLKNIYQYVKF